MRYVGLISWIAFIAVVIVSKIIQTEPTKIPQRYDSNGKRSFVENENIGIFNNIIRIDVSEKKKFRFSDIKEFLRRRDVSDRIESLSVLLALIFFLILVASLSLFLISIYDDWVEKSMFDSRLASLKLQAVQNIIEVTPQPDEKVCQIIQTLVEESKSLDPLYNKSYQNMMMYDINRWNVVNCQ